MGDTYVHVRAGVSQSFSASILSQIPDSSASLQNLKATMAAERTKGFSHVVVTSNLRDGFSLLIQSAGLGGMKHNTVLMAWPAGWTQDRDPSSRRNFIGKTKPEGLLCIHV